MKLNVQALFIAAALAMISCNSNTTDKEGNTSKTEEQVLREAVAQYPDSLLLKEKLIQHLEDIDNMDGAISEINKALQKDSLNARFWFKKGDLHINDDDTTAAIAAYLKSVEIFPEPAAIMTLGSVYAQRKNDSALMMADALLIGNKAAANKEALFIKGLYYNYKGDKQKAIAFMDDCIKLSYTFMFAYREKAIALYDIGKYKEALAVAEQSVTIQNTFDEGYYWMGRCYEKLNKPADAIESYKAAVLVNKDYIEAEDALARLGAK